MSSLRPSIGPLIGDIQADLQLSSGFIDFSAALPLISFGLFSPVVPRVTSRLGTGRTVALGLVTIIAGIGIRLSPTIPGLFVGTFIAGIGMAILNVVLPGLIKARFPDRVGRYTGLYSTTMSLFAATASGVSVPLALGVGLGWRGALAFWANPAVIALLLWSPQLRVAAGRRGDQSKGKVVARADDEQDRRAAAVWRSPLAWQVTIFMGLQSLIFYVP